MKALILAAGYATRLYPLTKEYPKPLLMVKGRPIIDHILAKLNTIRGINEILVVTNSKFISRFRDWKKRTKFKKPVTIVDDLTHSLKDRRGAVGDMDFVIRKKRIDEDLLVIGGDNLFDGRLSDFISFAARKNSYPVIGAYDIKKLQEAKRYGVLNLDNRNRIIDFQEKPRVPKSRLVAMCVYYLPRKTLSFIREYLQDKNNKPDATGFYIEWLRRKTALYAYVFGGCWYDIGDYKFYNKARGAF